MSLELIDPSKTYELRHEASGAVFVMRHWTVGMQEEVDRQCYVQDGKGGFQYLVSQERELKIQLTLKDWRGITLEGQEVPCNSENKKRLPVGIILWIIRSIDEQAGLRLQDGEKKI